jgi:hypothetical protein
MRCGGRASSATSRTLTTGCDNEPAAPDDLARYREPFAVPATPMRATADR